MISTGWDKSNHMLAFGVLTALGLKAFAQRLMRVLLCMLAYGALIEILQSFTPNRSAEWGDLLADAVGIALGFGLIQMFVRIGNSNARLHRSNTPPMQKIRSSGEKNYRSAVYRRVYSAAFVGAYLLLQAYRFFGDAQVSEDNNGIWAILLGMAIAGAVGALAGPRLHRLLFYSRAPARSTRRTSGDNH